MSLLKLEQQTTEQTIVVTLDGDLVGEYVLLVRSYLEKCHANDRRLILRLRDVQSIGLPGIDLLQELATQGVILQGCGLYTEYIIERILSKG